MPFLPFRLLLRRPLAADPQHAVLLDLDLDVFLLHPRHVDGEEVGGRGLLPIGAGDGEGFEALMDCDGGMFENSEGIVVGKDHVPGGSGPRKDIWISGLVIK